MFFFEKKNQKTFAPWYAWPISTAATNAREQNAREQNAREQNAREQKFFGSLFQKRTAFFLSAPQHFPCP
jgi:hypothetical protein